MDFELKQLAKAKWKHKYIHTCTQQSKKEDYDNETDNS